MNLPNPDDSVDTLKGVGPRRAALYRKLGICTIRALTQYYPRSYLDLSAPVSIGDTVLGENNVIRATVIRKQGEQRLRKGLSIFRVFASDETGIITITIFNSRFLFDALETEQEYFFYGKVTGSLFRREMTSPLTLSAGESARIRPVYSLTEGLTNKMVQANMRDALAHWGESLTDSLPEELRQTYGLCPYRRAVENIHFPENKEALHEARRRLIFEELLTLQLGMQLLRGRERRLTAVRLTDRDVTPFLQALPFQLTAGQAGAIEDALDDMTGRTQPDQRIKPMNRLVLGDVGSGKTMVAAALCYACHKNGWQSAIMAPTQILAEQHYETLSRVLTPLGVSCCLLTGGLSPLARGELLEGVKEGRYSVVIGTHALVQADVEFHALGLVVTDEQHRFGVSQRAALSDKGENPHLLVMSATPIPRTLALIIYGDLDVSAIRELPGGRRPIETFAIDSKKRGRALGFLKKHLDEGRQGYIVCPLIDDNESELVSIARYQEALAGTPLADCRIAALNGRMKSKEKEDLMARFRSGEIQVLVSTTVVEVGVDVPNANVMLIENAERFGLSQLHQLRGRVGRGGYQSFCILISDNQGEENRRRLKVMTTTTDGFEIAEEDLKLRGPGDFFGSRQHGLPALKIADLMEDTESMDESREAAAALLKEDPELSAGSHRLLREQVERLFRQNGQITLN